MTTNDNIYAPPESTIKALDDKPEYEFLSMAKGKFWLMTVATMGLYLLYWFYKNWQLQKQTHALKIWPAPRALFNIFFTHALFQRVHATAEKLQLTQTLSNHRNLASIFVGITVIAYMPSQFSDKLDVGVLAYVLIMVATLGLSFLSILPIWQAQKVINRINDDPEGARNKTLTGGNIVWVILGIFLWLLIINVVAVMVFFPEFLEV